MGLLDIFKSKKTKQKEVLNAYYTVVSDLFSIVARKRKIIKKGQTMSLDFDSVIYDKVIFNSYRKYGATAFLGKEFNDEFAEMLESIEIQENIVLDLWKYLKNEKKRLEELI